jgi:hypothetical protein
MIEQINQSWDVSVWKNNSRYVYLYSATNNVIELLMQTWDTSNWVNSLKLSVTYDSNDNMIEYLIQIWDVSVWKNDARYTFTYDADGNNTEATIQTWDGASWVNEIRELYYYAPATSIELISPNGGENWTVGSPANITWTSNNIASIKIQYTTNNGVSWINIANVTASAGSYTWFIPNTPSTDCKVLISDVSNALLNDESDSVFTISPFSLPALEIMAPNGGENWEVGSTHSITWSSNDVDSIKIDYSTNSGINWINIIPSVAAETGNYSWDIPNTPSTDCKVLLSDVSNALLNSQSTDVFTIEAPVSPVITVTSPNGGEDWETGSSHEITWISNEVTNVKIEYSINGGTNWINIIQSLAAEPGNYSWTIPNTPSANCKILVSDVSNALINDQSNDVFTISVSSSPVITVTSPNGNENWPVGSSHSIAWISSNVTNVKIDYSTNNGTNWINIVSSTPASAGSYSWTTPNTPSTSCKVMISDVANALINDQSNNVFTLFNYPSTLALNTSYSFGDPTQTSSYKIIGLPGAINLPIASVMTGSPGKQNDWRVFWDNGELPLIEYNGSNTFTFTPGKAFFVVSKNQVSIDQDVNAVTLTTDNSYSISLHNEWNLISNPFDKTITWSSVQSTNSVTQPIHYYSNGSYSTQSNFEPFKGYYFFNSSGLTNLKIPYITSSGLGKDYNTATNELEIFLSLNNIVQAQINAGFSDEASPGIDMLDIFSPPSVFCDVSMSIYNKEVETSYKYLQKEYRPEIGEGQEFNIFLKNTTDKNLEMVINGLQNFIDYEIYLLDKQIMRLYDLKITNNIEIIKYTDRKEYALFIGTKEFMKQKRADLLPSEFTLYQNYPNPFNPATKIMFAIPEQSKITLKIYNVLGELVADLINDQIYDAGYYELNFDGTKLASGIYIYRLQADGKSISRKMILVR